ncbi:MAG: hypothetical protein ACRC10_12625 [Thermoguttaceae bacterium]
MRKIKTSSTRNGVILLLMLALLTLFATLALAFILAAAHQKRLAEHGEKIGTGDARLNPVNTQNDLDLALRQLLRGAEGTVIGPHSILENLYGNVAESGTITVADYWQKGSPAVITLTSTELDLLSRPGFGNLTDQLLCVETRATWDERQMDFLGNVLTITSDGQLKNKSTRILGKTPSGKLVILPFDGMTALTDLANCSFVINGAPYSGEGAGYDSDKAMTPWDVQLTLMDSDGILFAERPNVTAPSVTPNPTTGLIQRDYLEYLENPNNVLPLPTSPRPPVRMNVDYTAPDANNMFLAWYDFNNPMSGFTPTIQNIIPSFHRPELVEKLVSPTTEDMLRKVVLRPLKFDHPDFTGSNPQLDTTVVTDLQPILAGNGGMYLDVDNDGDGVKDGIWLDVGLPVRQSADGTEYKPLVSITVLDLDGRTNVNVHGNSALSVIPTGRGYGPSGVNMKLALDTLYPSGQTREGAIMGNTEGRKLPRITGTLPSDSPLHGNYFLQYTEPMLYPKIYTGTPADLEDTFSYDPVNLDPFGSWVYNVSSTTEPYEVDVYHSMPYDAPFTAGELEGLLRTTDVDLKSLPKRLRELLFVPIGSGLSDTALADAGKYHLTTMSNDIPLPSRRIGGSPGIYSRLLTLMKGDVTAVENLLKILPEEVRNGERIDLNKLVQSANWVGGNHDEGLKERADLARGIYLLLMVMCYEQLYGERIDPVTFAVTPIAPYEEPSLAQETRLNTAELKRQVMATRLAQFAVNLVDFIDPDNAMTPMVFDIDPFDPATNGWGSVAGNLIGVETPIWDPSINVTELLDTPSIDVNRPGAGSTKRARLVWGLERPDVVMTETLATHDHKVAAYKKTGPPPAEKWKQVGMPEGSLWIELYNTANRNMPIPAAGVDLAEMAPPTPPDSPSPLYPPMPVWRIAISERANTGDTAKKTEAEDNNIAKRLMDKAKQPITFSMQSEQSVGGGSGLKASSVLGPNDTGAGNDVKIDRLVYFTTTGPLAGDPNKIDNVFWNQSGVAGTPALLIPGQFLVVAPRTITDLGSLKVANTSPVGNFGKSAGTKIDVIGTPHLIAEASDGASGRIGLNVSMPLGDEYKKYVDALVGLPSPVKDVDLTETATPVPDAFADTKKKGPLDQDQLNTVKPATIPMYRSVMLQRLADPMRAYDPVTNPYMTVDWNMVDLTTFTGEESSLHSVSKELGQDGGTNWSGVDTTNKNKAKLVSRQWGRTGLPLGLEGRLQYPNPWMRVLDTSKNLDSSTESLDDEDVTMTAPAGAVLQHVPHHTLGTLNAMYLPTGRGVEETFSDGTPTGKSIVASVSGVSSTKYVNLAWRDAPLANSGEIMLVPASSPGRFGLEFVDTGSEQLELDAAALTSPTDHIVKNGAGHAVGSLGSGGRFGYDMPNQGNDSGMGHLLNFFHSGDFYVTGMGTLDGKNSSLNLGALLEHVQVPSRFMGTKLWLDPSGADPYAVSLYREPGKINLNTVNEPTFLAMMGGRGLPEVGRTPTWTREYENFYNSRWTETATGSYLWPYRSYSGKNFVGVSPQNATDHNLPPSIYPDGGMLLRDAYQPDSGTQFLLQPLLVPTGAGLTDNSEMQLNGLMRLSGMSTNRSNCFAVWITIGYFEVERADNFQKTGFPVVNPATGSPYVLTNVAEKAKFEAIYPDGYVLGKEVGYDSGDVVRHRGFYLIDRTIPVGFGRGKDYNVLETVVTGRVIE